MSLFNERNDRMQQILTLASILVPLVFALTSLIKSQTTNYRILPAINLVAGILLGILYALSFDPINIVVYAWAGAVAGLAASGLFDLGDSMGNQQTTSLDYGDGQSETEVAHYKTELNDEE